MDFDMIGHVAEVGDDSELGAVGAKCKSDGISSIMRNSKGVNLDVANGKALAGVNGFDSLEPLSKRFREDALHRVQGRFRNVERRLPETEHLREAITVIGVLVGDENAVDVLDGSFDSREAGKRFALAETGVNEEAGPLGLEQCNIARAARRQYGYPQADRFLLNCAPNKFSK